LKLMGCSLDAFGAYVSADVSPRPHEVSCHRTCAGRQA
jgi:hypothetical protein